MVQGGAREALPAALVELCRWLDEADLRAGGTLLGPRWALDPQAILGALRATLMRGRVLAAAEARGLHRSGRSAGGLRSLEQRDPLGLKAAPAAIATDVPIEEVVGAYEELVSFELRVTRAATLVLLPLHVGVDLDALLAMRPDARAARVNEEAGAQVSPRVAVALSRAESVEALAAALERRASPRWPSVLRAGALLVEPGAARRRAGAHYTPPTLTRPLVERALAPLLPRVDTAGVGVLRVCDPAMGTGSFLIEAGRRLVARMLEVDRALSPRAARRLVAERCLYGVDADPLAVELARAALWLFVEDPDLPLDFAVHHLRVGDALLGAGLAGGAMRGAAELTARALGRAALHWGDAFPEVSEAGGFDAVVGNPPWVAYAGRAAQPLQPALFAFYRAHYAAFAGYRTLHGLFLERAASLLNAGGRLGMVVPTSVSDLAGYEPTRRAHDALAEVDDDLPDFGDAFPGVFQPSMGLISTRVAPPPPGTREARGRAAWPVARDDLDPVAHALMMRLAALPSLPPECFGERGFQSTGDDVKKLRATATPEPPFVVPIREGADVRAGQALPPRLHLDPRGLVGKLRDAAAFGEVRLLLRQTARFPVAAPADGLPFRNSVLAGFEVPPYDAAVLLAWLNASPIRWLHHTRHRDARQGMPQLKIAHLRAIPRVPGDDADILATLASLGSALWSRNQGISAVEQHGLDDVVARALGLDAAERALVTAWAERNPAP